MTAGENFVAADDPVAERSIGVAEKQLTVSKTGVKEKGREKENEEERGNEGVRRLVWVK